MTLVYAAFVPNAPFLIAPSEFRGAGEGTARALRGLDVVNRYRPDVIVVSSPHWVSHSRFQANASPRPRQVYDFSGFPASLSRVRYEPTGDPELARRRVEGGTTAGVPAETTEEWGLDHGAWAPLLHFSPDAGVPVVPISIQPRDPALHLKWGEAMRSVLQADDRRAVLLATGSIVHNFQRIRPDPRSGWPEGERIEQEIVERILGLDVEGLAHVDRTKWATVQPEGDLGSLVTLLGTLGATFRPHLVSRETAFGGGSLTTIEFLPR